MALKLPYKGKHKDTQSDRVLGLKYNALSKLYTKFNCLVLYRIKVDKSTLLTESVNAVKDEKFTVDGKQCQMLMTRSTKYVEPTLYVNAEANRVCICVRV